MSASHGPAHSLRPSDLKISLFLLRKSFLPVYFPSDAKSIPRVKEKPAGGGMLWREPPVPHPAGEAATLGVPAAGTVGHTAPSPPFAGCGATQISLQSLHADPLANPPYSCCHFGCVSCGASPAAATRRRQPAHRHPLPTWAEHTRTAHGDAPTRAEGAGKSDWCDSPLSSNCAP